MLILTRKIGETLVIGDEVYITVLGVKGNQVRLGCKAPEDISLHRQEIYDRIQAQKVSTTSSEKLPAQENKVPDDGNNEDE